MGEEGGNFAGFSGSWVGFLEGSEEPVLFIVGTVEGEGWRAWVREIDGVAADDD